MKQALSGCILMLVALLAAGDDLAPSISPLQLQSVLGTDDAPLLVDVRTAEEFAAGHVPGAINIPHDEIADRIGDYETPNGVALYCRVGPRARAGEAALMAAGFDAIVHVQGGLTAWQAEGLPVATGASPQN